MGYAGFAAVTVTPGSGCTNICSNSAATGSSPAFTTMGAITITEGLVNDMSVGTNQLILVAPTGWQFNTGATPTFTFTAGRNITAVTAGTFTTTSLAIDITCSNTTLFDAFTINGLQLQATTTGSTASYVYSSLGAGIAGITSGSSGTNFGNVSLAAAVAPSVSIAASPSTTICSGTGVTFTPTPTNGGTTPTYQWYLNGSFVATGLPYFNSTLTNGSTVMCVMTSNATCISTSTANSNTIIMTVNPLPTTVTASGAGTFCGSTTITAANGGSGTIYYQGTTSGGTSTAIPSSSQSVSASGTYYFRAQSGAGCWGAEGSVAVAINPLPTAVTVSGGGTVCGGTTITASNGGSGTIYFMGTTSGSTSTSTPSTSQSITTSGTYYFRALSSAGCWGPEGSATVVVNPLPAAVTVSGAGTFCGSTTITASGGAGGTVYFQGTTTGGTSTAIASTSQTVSTSGTYYFRSQSSSGCWGPEGSVTVTINTLPSAVTVTGAGTFCGSTTISATGGTGGTIYYQGATSGGTSTTTPSSSQSISASGTYYFRAQTSAGCWGTEGSTTVTINPLPTTVTVTGAGTFCGSTTITAANGGSGTIYYQGTTSGGTSVATPSTSQAISTSGTYYFRAQSGAGCWSAEGSAVVTINALPAAVTVTGAGTFCGSATLAASNGGDGTIYYQGLTSGGTSILTPSTSQSVSATGTYYFRALSSAGCWGTQGSAAVTINPLPTAVTVSGGGTFCGSTTITAANGGSGTIYYQGTTSGGTSTTTISSSQTISTSGTYYFRALSGAGCWGPEGSVTVTINPLPTAVTASGAGTFCGSTTITAANGGSGTIYYQAGTTGGTSTAVPSTSQTVSTTGTYFFRAQSSAGCWGPEGSVSVTINPLPNTVAVTGGGTYCGSTTISASNGGSGTIFFQGTTSGGTSTSAPMTSATITTSGTYYFRAQSGAGCWGAEGSVTVVINPLPTAVIATGAGSFCGSTTINASNGGSGTMYFQGTTTGGTSVAFPATSATVISSGTYYFRAQSGAGCWSNEGAVIVTINPLPNPTTVSGGGTFCGSTTITASNGGSGTIYFQGTTSGGTSTATPSTSQTITTPGTYYFRALSSGGCWGTEGSVNVLINPIPAPVTVTGGGTFCGSSTTLSASNGGDGTIYFQGTTSGGLSTTTPSTSQVVGASNTYYFRAQSLAGCWGTQGSATVVLNPLPNAVVASGGGTFCGSTTVTAANGGSGIIYFQGTTSGGTSTATPSTSQLITTSGTYYFRALSAAGCWGTEGSVTVTINPLPSTTVASGAGTFCGSATIGGTNGGDGTIYYQGLTSGGTSIATPATTQVVLSSGTYYFRARSSAGCWGTEGSVTVTVNPLPLAVTASGAGTFCGGTTITASNGGSGTIYFQGTTSGGTSTLVPSSSAVVSASGTYYFRAQSALGCWGPEGSVTVTINPLPATAVVTGAGTFCGSTTINADNGGDGIMYFQNTISGGTSTAAPSTSQVIAASGTYYFRAQSSAGCWGNQGSVSVIVNPLPTATTVTGSGTFCGNTTINASNGGSGTIFFQGNTSLGTSTTTPSISQVITTSGTYFFRARSLAGCWGTEGSATVTVNPLPATAVVTGSGTFCGSTSISADNGGDGTMYFQGTTSGGTSVLSPSISQTVSTTGVYYFRAQSGLGCWGPEGSVAVTINPLPTAVTVSGGGSFCGSATITAAGGTGGTIYYQGTTSGGTSVATPSSSIVISTSGTYYFRSRSAAGCWGPEGSVTVVINPFPATVVVSGAGSFCNSTTITATNGGDGVIYFQGTTSGGTSTIVPSSAEFITASGTYYFRAQSSAGCWSTQGSAAVVINPLPGTFTVTGGGSYCSGGAGVAVGLGGSAAGIRYQLYRDFAPVGLPVTGTGSAITFGNQTVAGFYTVQATSTITGCVNDMTGGVAVTILPLPTVFTMTGGGAYCSGDTGVHVGLDGSEIGINYQLIYGGVPTGLPVAGTGLPLDFGLETLGGVYTVVATNGTTGCISAMGGSSTVSINLLPSVFAVTGGGTQCAGGVGFPINLTGSTTGIEYQLYNGILPSGSMVIGDGTAITFGLRSADGVYTVVARNPVTGCTNTMTGSQTISNHPLPTAYTLTGGGSYCAGGTGVDVSISNSDLGIDYQLFNSGVPVGTPISGTGAAISFGLQTTPGFYTIVATDMTTPLLCTNVMSGVDTVIMNPLPAIFNVTGGGAYCAGGSGVLVGLDGSELGLSYQLSVGGVPTGAPLTGTGVALDFGLQTIGGSYTVDAVTPFGCTNTMTSTISVAVNALPVPQSVTGGGSYCAGGAGVNVGLFTTETGSIDYQLLVDGVPTGAAITGTGSAISFGLQTAAGLYTVQAANTITGCTNAMTGSATITIDPLPSIYTLSGGGAYCAGGAGVTDTLSGSTAGILYEYSLGGVAMDTMVGTGSPLVHNHTAAGTYTVMAINPVTGCTQAMSGSSSVVINPLPTAIAGPSNLCVGSTVTLTDADPSGTWNSSDITIGTINPLTGDITGVAAGVITITYTLPTTCYITRTQTINNLPVVGAITGTTTVCQLSSTTLADTTAGGVWTSGNLGVATIGAGTGVATGVAPGTAGITYTVTSTFGCVSAVYSSVSVNPVPAVTPIVGSITNVCAGLTIPLSDATTGGVWSSSNPLVATVNTSGTVTGVAFGAAVISYTMTNTSGCSSSALYFVSIGNAMPSSAILPTGSATLCNNNPVLLSVATTGSGLTYQWVLDGTSIAGATNFDYLAGTAGVYTNIIDNGTCNVTLPSVTVVNPPVAVISEDTAGHFLHTGAFASYQWFLNGVAIAGATTNILFETVGGSYTVVVGDGNGCTDTSDVYLLGGLVKTNKVVVSSTAIRIYPNPATSIVYIDAPEKSVVSIMSPDGRIIMDRQEAVSINIAQLSSGIYLVMVYDENNVLLKTERLIKAE